MFEKRLRYGLMAGVGTVAYLLLFYLISPRLMLSSWVMWGSMIIFIACMVVACQRERAQMNGGYPLRTALRSAFSVYVIASAIYYLFYFLLFGVIDPELVELQRTLLLENLEYYERVLGEDNVEEMMRRYQEEDLSVTLGNTILDFAWGLIGGFVISLIVAGVMQRG